MYDDRGRLGAFGSFLAFVPAVPAASLPIFAAGGCLTFFLGRGTASLSRSLLPPSLSLPDSTTAFFACFPAAAFMAAAGASLFFAPFRGYCIWWRV
eukprot:CAMPEP_0198704620 /NCGR_PEP_ID=MMETSP1468-20131203/389997_1 /TAXON_ID=1461545 /ORGANISM="Mantoniella sp, Strain CCMP1436" /LENGTH=95 /DNA_ID=CAMNT_0044463443 /DNA_START=396 /DNA_END=683 /DNA_ORIENTATION=+